ncbi:MAG TPA: efflux RND transporter periplasmic adaptor subunit [Candidatus Acidoferrales bacterium]|nr:efflux RND transporter periplasmic adaptor subunit [Candidatus Acidoferrales bacterium]
MRKVIFWAVVIAVAQGLGCGSDKPPLAAVSNAASLPTTASAPPEQPAPGPVDPGLIVSGPIVVEHEVDLTAQRDGVVAKILYDVPARVKAGTLLAQLDDRELQANLDSARAKSRSIEDDLNNWKAEREVMQADYVRAQELWKEGLTSSEQLQHAKYQVESHDWDIKRVSELLNDSRDNERSLELELEKTKIVAPFDGLVARRYVRQWQSVAKGDRLFWVTSEAPLLVRFTLPEKFFGKVRLGRAFEVESADAPGERHLARVREISPVVDPASGTFEVLVELTGNRGSLRPGMTASVHLDHVQ